MPPLIRSRYDQYKRDTQQFTTWLAQTAISVGYPVSKFDKRNGIDIGEIVQSAASKKNAKKKARAKAKKSKLAEQEDEGEQDEGIQQTRSGPDQASHPEPGGRYTLKLALFVPVAQYILEQCVSIPVEVTRLLKRCVSLRLKASRQFAAASDPNDDSHRYFIDVLVKIRDLFEQVITKSDSPSSDPSPKANAVPETLSNKFAALDVDDFEEDAEDIPDIQLPGVASSPETTSFEPEMSLGEAVNAVVIFLEDMERTREYIVALWQDYKPEKVDLITAAVTTNTALELMKKPHDDFVSRVMPVFDHHFPKMLWFTFVALRGHSTGNPAWDMPIYNEVNSRDLELARIYDFMMLPFIHTITGFTDLIQDNSVPVCRAGHWGNYNPKANFGKMPFLERWEQYQILLAESFTDMYFLLGLGDPQRRMPQSLPVYGWPQGANMFFVDETLVMMDKFIKTKEVDFLFTFAMRVLIDINFTLGPAANRGRQLLNNTAENGQMPKGSFIGGRLGSTTKLGQPQ